MIPGKKLIISLWLGALMMVLVVIAAPMVSSPDRRFARSLMESGDRKIETTLELAAASSAASLAVSAIPGDTATPVAEKLAVDLQDALVAAEDVVHLPHSLAVAADHTLYPQRHLRNIYCGKRNLINVIFYHIKLLTERNMRFHR